MLVDKLSDRMSKQGSLKSDIKILLNKIFVCHFEVFGIFAAAAKSFHKLFKL